ncbi:MAG: hypothetical protein ACLQLC_00225 [Candidatus Sulfotelmatobacter sp.]
MKIDPLLNRRVIFKLRGMKPLDSTILKRDETGYWICGGTLAPQLDQSNCSLPDNDVRYLEFTRIEWLRASRKRA